MHILDQLRNFSYKIIGSYSYKYINNILEYYSNVFY